MKRSLLILLFASILFSSCGYRRLADLNMVSNRNTQTNIQYEEIQRGVEVKVKVRDDNALEKAIDKATEEFKGEYMMNVQIYLSKNNKRMKIIGDVWGIPNEPTIVE